MVLSGSDDKAVVAWDLSTGRALATLRKHTSVTAADCVLDCAVFSLHFASLITLAAF